ncbi:MAG: ABC transporter ATP-binding protein [Rikenellaceae bacterium]
MEKIIECQNITHYYGKRLIYSGLNFEVERGRILGLLGKNGTGKTTIINILNGYLKPREGVCRLFGEDMDNIRPETKAKIGLLLEGHIQHTFFNVIEIEKFYSQFFKNWKREAYWELISKLKISQTQKISTMSCGQRSQVALGLLFAQDPDLLILDDFSMGLDPGYRRLFVEYLREYALAEGKTIFTTSHIIQDMELLIDDCMIMDYGKILLHKPTREILDNFRRFTFKSTKDMQFSSDEIYNPLHLGGGKWECFSFLPKSGIEGLLSPQGIEDLTQENINLENAFIGLTGKY